MSNETTIWGSEHVCVRRALAAGVSVGGPRYLKALERLLDHPEVPAAHRNRMLSQAALMIEAQAVEEPTHVPLQADPDYVVPKQAPAEENPFEENPFDDDFDSDLDDESIPEEPPHPVVQWAELALSQIPVPYLDDGKPKFYVKLSTPRGYEEPVAIILTARFFSKDGKTEWNMMGSLVDDRIPLNKYDPEQGVLIYADDRRLNAQKDFEGVYCGQPVKGTMFMWAVRFVPNRTFRMWFNERGVAGAKKDIGTVRFKLTERGAVRIKV